MPWRSRDPREPLVPLRVAEALQAERDALYRHLEQARREERQGVLAQAQRLEQIQDHSRRLERALDSTQEELLSARRELEELRHRSTSVLAPPASEGEDHWQERAQRLTADLANLRRHRDAAIEQARSGERVERLHGLAEVLDGAERAVLSVQDDPTPVAAGVRALRDLIVAEFTRAGARVVGCIGETFDPSVHEAIGVGPGPSGRVIEVVQHGVVLKDGSVVRPARVLVGS